MPRPLITLTTDFGEGSRYVAAMKGAALSVCPDAQLIDISHSVPPQDIATGARVLDHATRYFPPHAVHVAVVDPGVGTDREIVLAHFSWGRYVCPNNGLLTNLASREKTPRLVAVENAAYWLPAVSSTFHGRDIMAPVAAHLAGGLDPNLLGTPRSGVHLLDAHRESEGRRVGQRIEGEVVEVDSFGNLITNITAGQLTDAPTDTRLTVRCDEHETVGLYRAYAEQPPMTLIALVGSSDQLELAIVNDSAKMMLGVGVGAPVTVAWE